MPFDSVMGMLACDVTEMLKYARKMDYENRSLHIAIAGGKPKPVDFGIEKFTDDTEKKKNATEQALHINNNQEKFNKWLTS